MPRRRKQSENSTGDEGCATPQPQLRRSLRLRSLKEVDSESSASPKQRNAALSSSSAAHYGDKHPLDALVEASEEGQHTEEYLDEAGEETEDALAKELVEPEKKQSDEPAEKAVDEESAASLEKEGFAYPSGSVSDDGEGEVRKAGEVADALGEEFSRPGKTLDDVVTGQESEEESEGEEVGDEEFLSEEEDDDEDSQPRVPSFKYIIKRSSECEGGGCMLNDIAAFYKERGEQQDKFSASFGGLPAQLLVSDQETIWQQLLYGTEHLFKNMKKEYTESNEEIEHLMSQKKKKKKSLQNMKERTGERDIFTANAEDWQNVDADLAALDEEEEEEENSGERQSLRKRKTKEGQKLDEEEEGKEPNAEQPFTRKKYRKSTVDDKFFSLAKMHEHLEALEKGQEEGEEAGLFDGVEDDGSSAANYRYTDFFGNDDFGEKEETAETKKKLKKKSEFDEQGEQEKMLKKKEKRVKFADDVQVGESTVVEDEWEKFGDEKRVLLGPVTEEDEMIHTPLKANISKIKNTISRLEEKNLQEKPWMLKGEANAEERQKNTLLETHLEFDHGMKRAPEITEEFNEKIEAIILQRVKDKTWDDPVRVTKREEHTEVYRNQAIEEDLLVKKSLTEVYEKEYEKAQQNGSTVSTEEVLDKRHEEIQKMMREFFTRLDALTHFQFVPPAIKAEVRVISNMAALRKEEVGATQSTEEVLLAPEETKRSERGLVKGDEEREMTDKKRERRKKKMKQRAVLEKFGEKGLERLLSKEKDEETKTKKKKKVLSTTEGGAATKKFKSSEFFTKLSDTVQAEIREKSSKKTKLSEIGMKNGGAKFKL